MYPFLTLGEITISLVWIGVVLSCCYFLSIMYTRCKRFHLDYTLFLFYAPLLLVIPYLSAKLLGYLLLFRFSEPFSLDIILYILNPHGWPFSFVGLVLGFTIFLAFFLTRPYIRYAQEKRLYAFMRASVLSTILVWFFLIFGDTFMGKATESWFAIHPFTESATSLAKFDKVYPVWLILSFWAFVAFAISQGISLITKKYHWRLLASLFLFSWIFVFPFQHYPQYLVWDRWWIRLDIKYYFVTLAWVFALILWLLRRHFDPPHDNTSLSSR